MKFNANALALTGALYFTAASSFVYERLDRSKAALVVIDMQVGLFGAVRDFEPEDLHRAMLGHAEIAQHFSLPTVITTSADTSPTGPILGELVKMLPNATFIHRHGEINAYDSPEFRDAIAATNRTQFIIAGIFTDVCVAFVAQSLRQDGYSVWANLEASGTSTAIVRDAANQVMRDAGVHVVSWSAILSELARDHRDPLGSTIFPLMDRYSPALGTIIRAHRDTIKNGTLSPEEDKLP